MNTAVLIVRIASVPQKILFPGNLSLLRMQVEFAKIRKGKQGVGYFEIFMWGNLGNHLTKYYVPGDYIIIEGSLSLKKKKTGNPYQKDTKFAVKNFYPFLLAEDEFEEEPDVLITKEEPEVSIAMQEAEKN
jgi:single-stranded DNA-binding protein